MLPPGALADMVAGTYSAFAALAALRHAQDTAQGQVIDLSLFEPLFSVLGPMAAVYRHTGRVPQRTGSRSETSAPRNVYRCGDGGGIALSGSTQTVSRRLFAAIGRPELVTDPRFVDNGARLANFAELDAVLGDFFAGRPLAENVQIMNSAGVAVATVMDISGLLDTEYFASRGVVVDRPDVDGEPVPMHCVVPRLSGSPGSIRSPAPRLGQHTAEVMAELLTREQWQQVQQKGAFG